MNIGMLKLKLFQSVHPQGVGAQYHDMLTAGIDGMLFLIGKFSSFCQHAFHLIKQRIPLFIKIAARKGDLQIFSLALE